MEWKDRPEIKKLLKKIGPLPEDVTKITEKELKEFWKRYAKAVREDIDKAKRARNEAFEKYPHKPIKVVLA